MCSLWADTCLRACSRHFTSSDGGNIPSSCSRIYVCLRLFFCGIGHGRLMVFHLACMPRYQRLVKAATTPPDLAAIEQQISFHTSSSAHSLTVAAFVCVYLYKFLYVFVAWLSVCLCLRFFRSIQAAERCLAPIGRSGLWRANTVVAISVGAARWFVERQLHLLGGPIGRVPAHRSGRGGQALGRAQGQAKHELRQAEQSSAVSLNELDQQFLPTESCQKQVFNWICDFFSVFISLQLLLWQEYYDQGAW